MPLNYELPEHEYYPTPDETVQRLFSIIPINPTWSYLEPCKGLAEAIYRYMPEGSQWAELSYGVDYLETPFDHVDCVITNPPFSLTPQFLEKSLEEADVVIYLQRLGYLASIGRREFWNEHKPTNLIVLSKRPSFAGKGTDKTDYCWYVWDPKGRLGLTDTFYFV